MLGNPHCIVCSLQCMTMPRTAMATASDLDCACTLTLFANPHKCLYCRSVVAKTVEALGGIDILVNNASYQACLTVLPKTPIWGTKAGSSMMRLGLVALSPPENVKRDTQCPSMLQFSLLQIVSTEAVHTCKQGEAVDNFTQLSRERLEHTFLVNMVGMISLAQKVVEHMPAGGSIINVRTCLFHHTHSCRVSYLACTL